MKIINTITLMSAVVSAATAFAQNSGTPDPATQKREAVIEQREQNQKARIEQGVKTHSLTPIEENRLEKKDEQIENAKADAMKDGKITKKEFRKIERMQDRQSERIYNKKHNNRRQ